MRGLLLFLGAATILWGCSRKSLSVAETDVVLTIQDNGRDYSKYRTYLMPKEVVDLCQSGDDDSPIGPGLGGAGGAGGAPSFKNCKEANHSLDKQILDALRRNMDALGYVEISDPDSENPDVALLAGIVAQNNWYVATGSSYCYPYYYYYGCYYSTYSYPFNLPTNTILIDMIDVDESEKGKLSHAWGAIMKGLYATSSEKTGAQRVNDGMNQAFQQSSYLANGGE